MHLGVVQRLGAEVVTPPPTYWGMGPRIGSITAIYFVITLLIDYATAPLFQITFISWEMAVIISSITIATGIILYLATTVQMFRARSHQGLITTGLYRLVRHPMYAIGLYLLCPGVCLLFRSYLVITTPLVMVIVMMCMIPKEERRLVIQFGDSYRDYQKKVPMFWPLGRR